MVGVSGTTGAAPAFVAIMRALHAQSPGNAFPRPPGVTKTRVSFVPAIEPPRTELFLAGTEMPRIIVTDPTDARPRLLGPADGSVIALDPDIPPARQRVAIRARTGLPGVIIQLDNSTLPVSSGDGITTALWAPTPGSHIITLTDGRHVFDRVRISVR
jgi:penicillin-binding protein 1C